MFNENGKYCSIQDGCRLLKESKDTNELILSNSDRIIEKNLQLSAEIERLENMLYIKSEECKGLIRKLDLQEELARQYAHAACAKHGEIIITLKEQLTKIDKLENALFDIAKLADKVMKIEKEVRNV